MTMLSPTVRRGSVLTPAALILMAAAILAALASGAALASSFFIETDVERWGATYRTIELAGGDARACAAACAKDEACLAWTFVRPGARAPKAACELKSSVPHAAASPCCQSGVNLGSALNGR